MGDLNYLRPPFSNVPTAATEVNAFLVCGPSHESSWLIPFLYCDLIQENIHHSQRPTDAIGIYRYNLFKIAD